MEFRKMLMITLYAEQKKKKGQEEKAMASVTEWT